MNICIALLLSITAVVYLCTAAAYLCTVALLACSLLPCLSLNDRLERTLDQTTFMMILLTSVSLLLSSLIPFLV
ncbi:hypothetical protein [Fannyhessea vaginae]|uniref:hypothetical protein n=1 Tax=Fannyhessea vaginae TaxID=82135 RepID=UPI00079ACDB9|nr:hypothetical protein [Fannyhessea vaginae]KXG90562.1 hypothetical protein HMPREF3232_00489 [Fannyhessea vaginae]DAT32542.1 MAG TPA: hypothetical protein [Caudoviricetes sp.]